MNCDVKHRLTERAKRYNAETARSANEAFDSWLDKSMIGDDQDGHASFLRSAQLLYQWGAPRPLVKAFRHPGLRASPSHRSSSVVQGERCGEPQALERLIDVYCGMDPTWFKQLLSSLQGSALSQGPWLLHLRSNNDRYWLTRAELPVLCAFSLAINVERASRLPLCCIDDSEMQFLTSIAREICPRLSMTRPLWSLERADTLSEIEELIVGLSWGEYKQRERVVARFDTHCLIAVGKYLSLLQLIESVTLPVHSLWLQFSDESRMRTSLSPKIAGLSMRTRKLHPQQLPSEIESRIKAQAVKDGLLPKDPTLAGVTADDRWVYHPHIDDPVPALHVAGFLPLDFGIGYEDVLGPIGPRFTEDDMSMLTEKVERAIALIAESSPSAFRWIVDGVRVIWIRPGDNDRSLFGSSSWREYPGLISLRGIENNQVSVASISNAILHESIHTFLDQVEIFYPFCANPNRLYPLYSISPWTGRSLPIDSFVQACCVWYGLARFWAIARSNVASHDATEELNRARRGFLGKEYKQQLVTIGPLLRPDINRLLLEFQSAL